MKITDKLNKSLQKIKASPKAKKYTILALAVLSVISIGCYAILSNTKTPNYVLRQIIEPEAPITDSLDFKASTQKITKTEKDKTVEETVDNTSKLSYISKYILNIPNVYTSKYSPDQKKALILSWTSEPVDFIPGGNNTVQPSLGLSVVFENGESQIIEAKDIVNAEFSSNDQIYYQVLGDNYGIYAYNLKNANKTRFIQTSDIEAFKNITMITDDRFFFIQPKNGRYGFGSISKNELTVLGQNVSGLESLYEINVSGLSNVTLSKDKKNLIIFDNKSNNSNDFNYNLLILDSETGDITKPKFTTQVTLSDGDFSPTNNRYQFSEDGTLLTTGSDSTTIDLVNKKVIFKGEKNKFTRIKISPDNSKAIACTKVADGDDCTIKNLKDSKQKDILLPKDISEMDWVDSNTSVFVIGKSLYNFKLNSNKLEKVTTERGDYRFILKDKTNNQIIIKNKNIISELKAK